MRSLESLHDSIGRARELVTGIRTGRIRADARVVARLCEFVDDLAAITDEQYPLVPEPDEEQARLRDALLVEVPASRRAAGGGETDLAEAIAAGLAQTGDGTAATVAAWLRAARREGVARLATLLAALEDAAAYRDVRADLAHCAACASADGPGLCPDHERDLELAAGYRALAAELGGGQ